MFLEKVFIRANPVAATSPSVDLAVYFESLCPDSIRSGWDFHMLSPVVICNFGFPFLIFTWDFVKLRFVSHDVPSAWRLFGQDLRISYKPFGKASVSGICEIQQSSSPVSICWLELFSLSGCLFVCLHGDISIYLHRMIFRPYIFRDEYLQKEKDKDTHTQTKTNTKCFQDPMYAIFIKSSGFKDLKYYIGCLLVMTKTKTKTWFMHY